MIIIICNVLYLLSILMIYCYATNNISHSITDIYIKSIIHKYEIMDHYNRTIYETCEIKDMVGDIRYNIKDLGNNCEPWISRKCIYVLDHIITKSMNGLEWSCGSSTIWLGFRLKTLISIENSLEWSIKVRKIISRLKLNNKVSVHNINADKYFICRNESIFVSKYMNYDVCYKSYITTAVIKNMQYEYISIDGRARSGCIIRSTKLIKNDNGILILDNSERIRYKDAINSIPKYWSRYDFKYSLGTTTLWITHKK